MKTELFLKLYALALPVFFAVDLLWLGVIGKGFYQQQIGSLMKTPVNWTAAIIFYLLFLAGLVFFVIEPAVRSAEWSKALWSGAFFGLITYATYDLTNLATLQGWPVKMVVVDMLWGTVLSASVSVISFLLYQKLW